MDFKQLFKAISPEEIKGDVFTLLGKVFSHRYGKNPRQL